MPNTAIHITVVPSPDYVLETAGRKAVRKAVEQDEVLRDLLDAVRIRVNKAVHKQIPGLEFDVVVTPKKLAKD